MDAVVFDLMGTLVRIPPRAVAAAAERELAAILDVDPDAWSAAWQGSWRRRNAGALGGDIATCIRRTLDEYHLRSTPDRIQRAADARRAVTAGWLTLTSEPAEVLEAFARRDVPVAVLSVCGPAVADVWESLPWTASVAAVSLSCRDGVLKPDPAAYGLICSRLGVEPDRAMFVGDGGGDEVTGAAAYGLRAVKVGRIGEPPDEGWTGPAVASVRDVVALWDAFVAEPPTPMSPREAG